MATLISHWAMDDGSGSTAVDATSGHDMTLHGTYTWGPGHDSSGGLQPTTGSDFWYGTVASHADFNLNSGGFSLAMWIYVPSATISQFGILERDEWQFRVRDNGSGFRLGFLEAGAGWHYSTSALPTDQWVHVAVTVDGSNAGTFYIAGAADGTFTADGHTTSTATVYCFATSGLSVDGGSGDEARVYSGALTGAEVATLAGASTNPPDLTYDDSPYTVHIGEAITDIVPSNAGDPATTCTVDGGGDPLPTGLSVAGNGTISGTPSEAGTFNVIINNSNSGGAGPDATLTITVYENLPVISYAGSPFDKIAGDTSSTANVTNTGDGGTFAATGLPGGCSINSGTGQLTFNPGASDGQPSRQARITCTNTAGTGSTTISVEVHYEPTIRATNADGTDDATVVIRIIELPGGGLHAILTTSYSSTSYPNLIPSSMWQ